MILRRQVWLQHWLEGFDRRRATAKASKQSAIPDCRLVAVLLAEFLQLRNSTEHLQQVATDAASKHAAAKSFYRQYTAATADASIGETIRQPM